MRFFDRLQPAALLALRLVLGAIMVVHGYPKVFGGLHEHVHLIASFGLPGWLGYVSAFAQFGGGLFLFFGVLTRYAALALLANTAGAIWKMGWKNGFIGENNYQFALALAAMALVFVCFGGGPVSLDRWLFRSGGPSRAKS